MMLRIKRVPTVVSNDQKEEEGEAAAVWGAVVIIVGKLVAFKVFNEMLCMRINGLNLCFCMSMHEIIDWCLFFWDFEHRQSFLCILS